MTSFSYTLYLRESQQMFLSKILFKRHAEICEELENVEVRTDIELETIEDLILSLKESRTLASFSRDQFDELQDFNFIEFDKFPKSLASFNPELFENELWFKNRYGKIQWCSIQKHDEYHQLYFVSDAGILFDKLVFRYSEKAINELNENGFLKYTSVMPEPPKPPFRESRRNIYSSHLFWYNDFFYKYHRYLR